MLSPNDEGSGDLAAVLWKSCLLIERGNAKRACLDVPTRVSDRSRAPAATWLTWCYTPAVSSFSSTYQTTFRCVTFCVPHDALQSLCQIWRVLARSAAHRAWFANEFNAHGQCPYALVDV